MITSILILFGILVLDRAVKVWALVALEPVGTIPVIQDVFHLTYTENTGAAFSILSDHTWMIIVITAALSLVLLYFVFFKKLRPAYKLPLLFVAAGGMGNLIDRFLYGFVVDMFDFRLINFAIFNIADVFITIGGIWFLVTYLFIDKGHTDKAKVPEHADDSTVCE